MPQAKTVGYYITDKDWNGLKWVKAVKYENNADLYFGDSVTLFVSRKEAQKHINLSTWTNKTALMIRRLTKCPE